MGQSDHLKTIKPASSCILSNLVVLGLVSAVKMPSMGVSSYIVEEVRTFLILEMRLAIPVTYISVFSIV